jgi:hypothetical protein
MDINKLIRPIGFGVVIVLLFIFLIMIFGEDADVVKNSKSSSAVTFGFWLTFVLLLGVIVAVFMMSGRGLINKPKSAIIAAGGFVALILFFFIGYAIDAGEVSESYLKGGIETPSQSKRVGGILNATIIVMGFAILFSIAMSVKDLINRING